jgi:hypothetical protein
MKTIPDFALSRSFTPGDSTVNQWSGCRLNPQMAIVITLMRLMTATPAGTQRAGNSLDPDPQFTPPAGLRAHYCFDKGLLALARARAVISSLAERWLKGLTIRVVG